MSNDPQKTGQIRPSGKQFKSVSELMRTSGLAPEVKDAFCECQRATAVCQQLALLRTRSDFTQEQMGEQLGLSQSAVSKLEAGRDDDLTLGQIQGYCKATGQRLGFAVGKPLTKVEAIKSHALAMREAMLDLAGLAHSDSEIEQHIQGFFGEAFFNILQILSECQNQMPNANELRIEVAVEGPPPSRNTPIRRVSKKRKEAMLA